MSLLMDTLITSLTPAFQPLILALFAVGAMTLSVTIAFFSIKMIIEQVTGHRYIFKHGRFFELSDYDNYYGSNEYNEHERELFYSKPARERRGKRFKSVKRQNYDHINKVNRFFSKHDSAYFKEQTSSFKCEIDSDGSHVYELKKPNKKIFY